MIFRKLRLKIALVLTAIVFLLVAGLDVGVLVSMKTRNDARVNDELRFLMARLERVDAPFGTAIDGESSAEIISVAAKEPTQPDFLRGLTAVWNTDDDTMLVDSGSFDAAFAEELARSVARSGARTYGNFRCLVAQTERGYAVAAVDESIEKEMFRNTAIVALSASAFGIFLIFGVVWWLSARMIRPVKTSVEKQKIFVADASHELKTPLTIINANAEALRQEIHDNRWLDNIRAQTVRMNGLVQEMLKLARLEEESVRPARASVAVFDASRVARNVALSFEEVAFEAGKELVCDVAPNVAAKGEERDFADIVSVLADNAVKYAATRSAILVRLAYANGKAIFSVENRGCPFADADRARLFERFYRGDASRDRGSGGTGLGLAIAARAAERNRWKLEVFSREGEYVRFVLVMRGFHQTFS